MDIFGPLKKLLGEKLAGVEFHIDEPVGQYGIRWMNVHWKGRILVVQWNHNYQMFGASDPGSDPDYFTHQPDHLFKTEAEVTDWAVARFAK